MNEPVELAQALLQEAVYRSRERQAAGAALSGLELADDVVRDAGNCGLGQRAEVDLDLTARGAELVAALWPAALDADARERLHAAMTAWVRRQDALDRKRNHFLRDFRGSHGYDRTAYSPEVCAAFEDGLAEVNAEVARGLRAAARELLAATRPSP
jgi:hypothetical protein